MLSSQIVRQPLFMVISSGDSYEWMINRIRLKLINLNSETSAVLQWVKGHSDITGNVVVGRAASLAHLNISVEHLPFSLGEYISKLKLGLSVAWNESWEYKVGHTSKGTFLFNNCRKI